jgi:hypothetical protein
MHPDAAARVVVTAASAETLALPELVMINIEPKPQEMFATN